MLSRRAHLAGVSALKSAGRSCSRSTCSGATRSPSATRFQAASKRSSASRGGPTRISRTPARGRVEPARGLAKPAPGGRDIALEVVAQLLDRAEAVRGGFSFDDFLIIPIQDEIAKPEQ